MEKYIILGHENPDVDSIISGVIYKNYLKRKGCNVEFIIPDSSISKETLDICIEYGVNPEIYQKELKYDKNTKFILLDHHNRKNIGEIAQIIDHHPTKEKPPVEDYTNKASSSTTCILVRGYENDYTKYEIELACLAAMVDTASFHSTKSTIVDKIWVQTMCKNLKLNYYKLYKSGLCLTDITDLKEASLNGLKKYNYNGYNVESSYIQIQNIKQNQDKITKLITMLSEYTIENELAMFVFLIHDMDSFNTTAYQIDQNGFTHKKYNQYTSRGSTIMPEIETYFKNQEPNKQKIKKVSKVMLKLKNIEVDDKVYVSNRSKLNAGSLFVEFYKQKKLAEPSRELVGLFKELMEVDSSETN